MPYLGIDYGTAAIKIAEVGSISTQPLLLPFRHESPFLPTVVGWPDGGSVEIGFEASSQRQNAKYACAVNFRDRIIQPTDRIYCGDQERDAVTLHSAILGYLKACLNSNPSYTALAVPDCWKAPHWALSLAFEAADFFPQLLVRESAAVLAMQDSVQGSYVLLLSLGASAATATLCVRDTYCWRPLATELDAIVSGANLRKKMIGLWAEAAVREFRRDPREDDHADQLLHDAVDVAFRQLASKQQAVLKTAMFDREFRRTVTLKDVSDVTASWADRLTELVRGLLQSQNANLKTCPIIAWGELSELLPLERWLSEFSSRNAPLLAAPLDLVASGAARLGAFFGQIGSSEQMQHSQLLASINVMDGSYQTNFVGDGSSRQFVPILERLPLLKSTSYVEAFLMLHLPGLTQRVKISKSRTIIGRRPDCDIPFDDDRYDVVSGNHAEITVDGHAYVLRDLDSSNGTFLNGSALKGTRALADGDEIRLGLTGPTLVFGVGEAQ